MKPYLEAQTTKIGLWAVALSRMYNKSGKTCTFRADPTTWEVDSGGG